MDWFRTLFFLLGVEVCFALESLESDSMTKLEDEAQESEGKETLIVHVVPHTHDDTGWIMSVDRYYQTEVRFILDTVIHNLLDSPDRRFSYVEMAFFSRWWEEQTEKKRDQVRKLVKTKQLEFVNGGWCMHDEATPYYLEQIDQTTRGHQFILKTFGREASPKATWSIDPFGHTNTQAWLLSAEAGMPSVFFGRMNGRDREARFHSHAGEWIWQGSQSIKSALTYTQQFYGEGAGHYYCPIPFERYEDPQVFGNKHRHDYNADTWIPRVVNLAKRQRDAYKTKHLLWACGQDFSYKNAATWYRNFDDLMKVVNEDGRVKMIYSTPGDYVAAVNGFKDVKWEVRKDDLIPYEGGKHDLWTGYYSSRMAFKRLMRKSSNLLQVARQIHSFGSGKPIAYDNTVRPPIVGETWTDAFEAAIALATHHDGISGTEKQDVNGDYALRISEGLHPLHLGMAQELAYFTRSDSIQFCTQLNISICEAACKTEFNVLLWNPLSKPIENYLVTVPVCSSHVERVGDEDSGLEFQVLPVDALTKSIPSMYINHYREKREEVRESQNTHLLLFQVSVPAMGYASIPVRMAKLAKKKDIKQQPEQLEFNNGVYKVVLDKTTKKVKTLVHLPTGVESSFEIQWGFYESSEGGCFGKYGCDPGPSGAYIFRPNSTDFHHPGDASAAMETEIFQGPIVTEIRQKISSFVYHVIRLIKGCEYVEVEHIVGPLPMDNPWFPVKAKQGKQLGKELAVRYKTDVKSKATLYTDSNGREMVKRVRNSRPASFPQPYEVGEPIASNYYPITSMISIEDDERELCVVTDATHGGSSINDGEVELMVLRRNFKDDNKGVSQPLNETMCGCNGTPSTCYCSGLLVKGVHKVMLTEKKSVRSLRRRVNQETQLAPYLAISSYGKREDRSFLKTPLPENVNVLTYSRGYENILGNDTVLLRLDHIYAVGEGTLAEDVTIVLSDHFIGFQSASEVTLTANVGIEDKLVYEWNLDGAEETTSNTAYNSSSSEVVLKPQQIRTFIMNVGKPQ